MIDKVKNLLINPTKFWKEIEVTSLKKILFPFAFVLAAILPVSSVIGLFLFRNFLLHTIGLFRVILFLVVLSYCVAILVPLLTGYAISYLLPYFGSERNTIKTIAMTVYSVTPFWLASFLNIYPPLFPLSFLGFLYSLYIFFMGCLYYLGMNPERAIGFTLISAGIWVIITYIFAFVLGVLTFGGLVIGVPLRI